MLTYVDNCTQIDTVIRLYYLFLNIHLAAPHKHTADIGRPCCSNKASTCGGEWVRLVKFWR